MGLSDEFEVGRSGGVEDGKWFRVVGGDIIGNALMLSFFVALCIFTRRAAAS